MDLRLDISVAIVRRTHAIYIFLSEPTANSWHFVFTGVWIGILNLRRGNRFGQTTINTRKKFMSMPFTSRKHCCRHFTWNVERLNELSISVCVNFPLLFRK